jgi:hypothetical protein
MLEAFGRKAPSPLLNSDRGSAIPIPDPGPARAMRRRQDIRPPAAVLAPGLSVFFTRLESSKGSVGTEYTILNVNIDIFDHHRDHNQTH